MPNTSSIISGRDFVIVGLQSWDTDIGSNCKNIALEIARNNRVLYVNAPLDTITAVREKNNPLVVKRKEIIAGKHPDLEKVAANIWELNPKLVIESINWIGIPFLFDALNKRNNRRVAKAIKEAIDRLEFTRPILFNDSDMFRSFYLKEMLQPDKYIYYTRDNLLSVDYWKKHGNRCEPELMRKSDAVVANSVYLADIAARYNPQSHDVGQGCEVSMFDMAKISSIPADIIGIKGPVIGYIGALSSLRLDIALLEAIATRRPDWNIVLVGPEDEAFLQSRLHVMENVFFLGGKRPEELPAYLARFDVAINPQVLNEATIGNYPRKIDEYLAMGKPVVATRTIAMGIFSEFVYLAEDAEGYIQGISLALERNTPDLAERREIFARSHTWENSVSQIYKVINQL